MAQDEQRRSVRVQLRIPIRVVGFSAATGEFREDTHTLVVNRSGALICLNQNVLPDDEIRIINLETYSEADFRVVGSMSPSGAEAKEWGVVCTEMDRNIWGIEFPPPLPSEESAALLECRACRKQGVWPVTAVDLEVLDSTGIITRSCDHCGKMTYWTYAEAARRPREFSPSDPVVPLRGAKAQEKGEKRSDKRLAMKLPILVRNSRREEEVAKTENVSKRGVAVALVMELAWGERVDIILPYSQGGEKIWQKAEVRRRGGVRFGEMRSYGLRFVQ